MTTDYYLDKGIGGGFGPGELLLECVGHCVGHCVGQCFAKQLLLNNCYNALCGCFALITH